MTQTITLNIISKLKKQRCCGWEKPVMGGYQTKYTKQGYGSCADLNSCILHWYISRALVILFLVQRGRHNGEFPHKYKFLLKKDTGFHIFSCICNSLIFLSCSFIYLAFPSYLLSAFLIYKTFRNAGQLCSFSSEEQKSFPLFALHLWWLGTGIEFHSSNMEFLVATVPILNVKLKADFAEGLVWKWRDHIFIF